MALYARRKLVQLHDQPGNEEELPSLVTRLESHCHSLGRAISRIQQPHIRLRQGKSSDHQARRGKRGQRRTASSPFATMSLATVPHTVCRTGNQGSSYLSARLSARSQGLVSSCRWHKSKQTASVTLYTGISG